MSRIFVITEDVIGAGVPRGMLKPEAKGGEAFRIYDDDGELYYRGRLYDPDGRASGFEPLDWAMGHVTLPRSIRSGDEGLPREVTLPTETSEMPSSIRAAPWVFLCRDPSAFCRHYSSRSTPEGCFVDAARSR